jgi:molybdenum ABC transporter molybdate-binding protein
MPFPRLSFNRTSLAFLASVVVLAILVAVLALDHRRHEPADGAETKPLVVYVAAGIRQPIEAAAREYEKEYHTTIQFQYAGSGELLAQLEVARRGDLYIPADDSYLKAAQSKNLVDEILPLARMHAVIAVKKGNPKRIASIDDLLKADVKPAIGNPEVAASGKLVRKTLKKSGQWDAFDANSKSRQMATEPQVANAVKIGSADAGIVWDTTVALYPDLERIEDPTLSAASAKIAIGVLRFGEQPTAALRFARYLAARDRGLIQFKNAGYEVVDGDAWALNPQLHVLAGAMLRPAIDQTIAAFEHREECQVTRVYNGCGILVAQMKAGERPDAYFSCDTSFMSQVQDLFLDQTDVSQNQLVIIVPRGNPHSVHSLADMGKPGLRVGVGHEKQCAMGALTQTTLDRTGMRAAVMANVKVQVPTGDMLVNELRAGALDAVIAYISNAASAKDSLETIPINIPCALAVQPVAVGKESKYKYMMQRLLNALESKQSKERFEAQGFIWKLGQPPK